MGSLFCIVFIDLVGFGVVIPLLPYYGLTFHASPFEVTAMMACYSVAQFVTSPLLGRLSDRVGRRPVLLFSLACFALSYVGMAFSTALWMLFAARLFAGACAGNIATAQAYIADITPPEKRARGMGLIGAAFGLGFTLGPPIGGILAGDSPTAADLARPAFVAAGLSAIAFFLVVFLLRESLPAAARATIARPGRAAALRLAVARPELGRLVFLMFATVTAFAGMETTFALWATASFGWGPEQVGSNFFYVGVVLATVQGVLIGPLSKRFGEARLVAFGAASIGLGLFAVTWATVLAPYFAASPAFQAVALAAADLVHVRIDAAVIPVALASALLALGMGLFNPSLTSLISRQSAADEHGMVMGVSQSAGSLARIVGPLIAGTLFQFAGPNAPYYAGGMVMIVVALAATRLRRRSAEPLVVQSEPRPS